MPSQDRDIIFQVVADLGYRLPRGAEAAPS